MVQPVGGRTLINFETNFFTSTTDAKVQPVQLLGRDVEIEATPTSYTWHWGDGSEPEQTANPGAEHRGRGAARGVPRLHRCGSQGPAVGGRDVQRPRTASTVAQWFPIAETLTVEGDPVALEVVSARVQLVG